MATTSDVEARDPAASMSLIFDAMRHPIDPLYEDVARRRQEAGTPHRSRRYVIGLITVVVGLLIGCAASALRVPKAVESDRRAQLVTQVEDKQRANDRSSRSLTALRQQVTHLQAAALDHSSHGGLRSQLSRAEATAGLTPVRGDGLEVRLSNPSSDDTSDSADSDPRTGGDAHALGSRDIQQVVNGLWAAGATDIVVNDQRLTSLSAIRFAGSAVLVNYRPLTTPYVIHALGPASMAESFSAGPGGSYASTLEKSGFGVNVMPRTGMTLPAAATAAVTHARVSR